MRSCESEHDKTNQIENIKYEMIKKASYQALTKQSSGVVYDCVLQGAKSESDGHLKPPAVQFVMTLRVRRRCPPPHVDEQTPHNPH